jgi:pre-rRNA-processing protein TSR1
MGRSYLLAEEVHFDAVDESKDGAKRGTLKVTGVVRGSPMSADRLVHIQNWGDYRLNRIIAAPRRTKDMGDGSMEVEDKVLSERTEEADDLASVVEVDELAGEQTWPTEEEMRGVGMSRSVVDDSTNGKMKRKKVPKGTSAYQAAWLLDDEEVESDEEHASSTGDPDEDAMKKAEDGVAQLKLGSDFGDYDNKSNKEDAEEDEEEYEEVAEEESSKAVAFEDMDMEEEKRQYVPISVTRHAYLLTFTKA